MDENKANRSDRATEPDLAPAPQVPQEELSSTPEPQTRDLSSGPEDPDKEVSPPPEAPEAQTSKERTSDARTESLEEPQGSEGERRSAASEARRRGIMVATAIAVLALLLLGRRIRSSRRR